MFRRDRGQLLSNFVHRLELVGDAERRGTTSPATTERHATEPRELMYRWYARHERTVSIVSTTALDGVATLRCQDGRSERISRRCDADIEMRRGRTDAKPSRGVVQCDAFSNVMVTRLPMAAAAFCVVTLLSQKSATVAAFIENGGTGKQRRSCSPCFIEDPAS